MASAQRATPTSSELVAGEYLVGARLFQSPLAVVSVAQRAEPLTSGFVVWRLTTRSNSGSVASASTFREEIDRMASLRHRAITPVVACGVQRSGPVVVTRPASTETLRDVLLSGPVFDRDLVVRIISDVASALGELHRLHPAVAHRAVCPDHITVSVARRSAWLEASGFIHVLAVANWLPDAYQDPAYLSPEALTAEEGPQGDTFALASIAYECLTGQRAFPNAAGQRASEAYRNAPVVSHSVAGISPSMDRVFLRAFSIDPKARHESPAAFASEFGRALAEGPSAPARGTASSRPSSPSAPPRNAAQASASDWEVVASSAPPSATASAPPSQPPTPAPPRMTSQSPVLSGVHRIATPARGIETAPAPSVPPQARESVSSNPPPKPADRRPAKSATRTPMRSRSTSPLPSTGTPSTPLAAPLTTPLTTPLTSHELNRSAMRLGILVGASVILAALIETGGDFYLADRTGNARPVVTPPAAAPVPAPSLPSPAAPESPPAVQAEEAPPAPPAPLRWTEPPAASISRLQSRILESARQCGATTSQQTTRMRVRYDPSTGRAAEVTFRGAPDPQIAECLRRASRATSMPPWGEGTYTHPFNFGVTHHHRRAAPEREPGPEAMAAQPEQTVTQPAGVPANPFDAPLSAEPSRAPPPSP